MSFALIRWAWGVKCNSTEKLTLLALADCCNGENGSVACWPSMAHLEAMTGLSSRTLQRAFLGLEAAGHITRSFGRGRETTRYTLTADPRQNDAPRPVKMTPLPRQNDAPPPSDCRPSPVNLSPVPGRDQEETLGKRERGSQTTTERGALSQSTIPDWAEICQETRPDLEPEPVWQSFTTYHIGQLHNQEVWAKKWRMWICREWKNRCNRTRIIDSDSPGAFLDDIGSATVIPGDYSVEVEDANE